MSSLITEEDFKFLSDFSYSVVGIRFRNDKKYLFENRLPLMAKEFNCDSIKDLIAMLKAQREKLPIDKKDYFVDLVTTHETLFFRDRSPFTVLSRKIIPEKKDTHLSIYSAACSTGQEPVSIAITLAEARGIEKVNFEIDATDISKMAVDYAKQGLYTQMEVQRGMPIQLLNKYFKKKGEGWAFGEQLLSNISYRTENLNNPTFKFKKYDIIFCRNVLIYFEKEDVRQIIEHFHKNLKEDGVLILGSTDSMMNHRDLFKYNKIPEGVYYTRVE